MNWIAKLLSGFNPANPATWGKLIYFGAIFLLFQMVWTKLTAPTTTQDIQAQTVVIEQREKRAFLLGVKIWKVRAGFSVE